MEVYIMGRPTVKFGSNVSLYLSSEAVAKLKLLAKKKGVSMSDIASFAIIEYYTRHNVDDAKEIEKEVDYILYNNELLEK
jgi:predicted transcriptional regulator